MSLWCGNCNNEVFEGFGLLYRLDRTSKGKLRYPDRVKGYVPANSAICDKCWKNLSASEKHAGKSARTKAERNKKPVFAYAPADSPTSPFWGSKTWSGIVAEDDKLVFVNQKTAFRHFPNAVRVIDTMTCHRRQRNN